MTAAVMDVGAQVNDRASTQSANSMLIARIERLPVTPRLMLIRVIVGIATFFDA